jgi:hypothetical protein
MKKGVVLMRFTMIILIMNLIFTSCAAVYKGVIDHSIENYYRNHRKTEVYSIDNSIPLSEYATLRLQGGLILAKFNDEPVLCINVASITIGGRTYISIPAGEHTLTFAFLAMGSTAMMETSAMIVKREFEPGNIYRARLEHLPGNRARVQIILEKEKKPNNTLSAPELQYVLGFGNTSRAEGIHFGLTYGRAYENEKTRYSWNAEIGTNVGIAWGGIDLYIGGNFEQYFNRKGSIGASIGGGLMYPDEGLLHPYLKLGMQSISRYGFKWGFNGSYFFRDFLPTDIFKVPANRFNDEYWKIKNFGFGVFISF